MSTSTLTQPAPATALPDPLLTDPPGTVDERISSAELAALPTISREQTIHVTNCPNLTCQQPEFRAVTGKAHDGSRLYRCSDCDTTRRRNWLWGLN